MQHRWLLPILTAALLSLSTSAAPSPAGFGQALFSALGKEQPRGNLALSPLSAGGALRLVADGAAGATRKELDAVVPSAAPSGATVVVVARGITLDPIWRAGVEAAGAHIVDGVDPEQARAQVNAFVSSSTSGAIPQLLAAGPAGAIVIVNALRFAGKWQIPFADARPAPFFVDGGAASDVPTMHLDDVTIRAARTKNADVVVLPYNDSKNRMVLVVPKKRQGVVDVGPVAGLIEQTRFQEVKLALPRFHVDSSFDLRASLQELGVKSAFACAGKAAADFSAMGHAAGMPLCLAEVRQSVVVDVDEAGTTAVAGTAALMAMAEGEREHKPLEIRADHPFFFFIVDEDNDVLFAGRVGDPAKGS